MIRIDAMQKFSVKSVRLVFTSLRYILRKNFSVTSDRMSVAECEKFSREWMMEAARVLTETGPLWISIGA